MRNLADLEIGCAANGVTRHDTDIPDVNTKFRWVRDAGVFDYIDRAPPDEEFAAVLKAAERHGLPVRAGTGQYVMGRDEALFERHVIKARLLGARVHNMQLQTHHADGHPLSDAEVAGFYLRAQDFGLRHGVAPCFEVHVDMWSEHFGRIEQVAALVEARGVPLRLTLDASHVVFKVDNPAQQAAQGLAADVASGRLVIDSRLPGHVISRWVAAHRVLHAHARGGRARQPVEHAFPPPRRASGPRYPIPLHPPCAGRLRHGRLAGPGFELTGPAALKRFARCRWPSAPTPRAWCRARGAWGPPRSPGAEPVRACVRCP